MKFFIVSAGKPNSDYIEWNFDDIINTNEFALHKETKQKGTYYSIEPEDILILKYDRKLVAYGIVTNLKNDPEKDFQLRAKVEKWIFYDSKNPRNGISRNGIQKATIAGGMYGTVKTVRPNFAMKKIAAINQSHPDFKHIEQRKAESNQLNKEGEFFKLHEELFNHLIEKTELDPEFTFVVRETNNNKSLEEGYWFYGNETVALSFWTGMDNLKQIPAISFLVDVNRHCKVIIQTDIYKEISQELAKNEFWSKTLELNQEGTLFYRVFDNYNLADYLKCLDDFLVSYLLSINELLERSYSQSKSNFFEYSNAKVIEKFSFDEFNSRINNLYRYRQESAPELSYYSLADEKKADCIETIRIKGYGLIKDETIEISSCDWVFITGENGSGKTMLLRAIGSALGNRTLTQSELNKNEFLVEAELRSDEREISFSRTGNSHLGSGNFIVTRGLAMYGPYRLQQSSVKVEDKTFRKSLSKIGSFSSLFEEGAKLLSLEKQIEIWYINSNKLQANFDMRIKRIISLLPKLIPDLRAIEFKRKGRDKISFEYLIKTPGSEELITLKWNELSSGNRSILNLVSDIIVRLFNQQPKITDPSELRGIVLIDEIDLHLHPKAQRDIIETLSKTFPLIQFIVTTHSPIPLLGAPRNSAIFVVKRDWERGVYTKRLNKLENELRFLLPNTLLTSDIFDFDILKDISADNFKKLPLEDNYNEIEKNKQIDKRLKSLDKSIFPDNLFNN